MSRRLLKALGARGLHATGADRLLGAVNGRGDGPLVLCYHRVVEDVRDHPLAAPAMLVSARTLERQLDWVGRRYRFVSLDELGPMLEAGGPPPGRPVAAVTFDDGYADVYRHGFPVLSRKGIPGAVFVTTDLLGTDRVHAHDEIFAHLKRAGDLLGVDALAGLLRRLAPAATCRRPRRLRAVSGATRLVELAEHLLATTPRSELPGLIGGLKRQVFHSRGEDGDLPAPVRRDLRTMTWPMLREMRDAGVVVGSHTRTHRVLPNEEEAEVVAELALSRQSLQEGLGVEVRHLAYPDGQYCPTTVAAAEAAGYRYAYTTCYHGFPERPLLAIPRRTFWERSSAGVAGAFSPAVAACQARGVFDWARPCRNDHRGRRRHDAPGRPTTLGTVTT